MILFLFGGCEGFVFVIEMLLVVVLNFLFRCLYNRFCNCMVVLNVRDLIFVFDCKKKKEKRKNNYFE